MHTVLRVEDEVLGSITWAPLTMIHPDSCRRMTCTLGAIMAALDQCGADSLALNGACSDRERELVDWLEVHFR